MLTLGQLMVRSQLNNGFVRVHVVNGLMVAVYRPRNSQVEEHWHAFPDTDQFFLKRVKSRNASTK